jgi:hypothetical protein
MTKEEIIKIIVVTIIGAFSKSLFDNLLVKYIPDKKKLNLYIINFMVFILRYVLPTYFLISTFFSNDIIDKFFVFKVSIYTSVLFFNLLIDIQRKQRDHFDRVLNVVERIHADNEQLKIIANKIVDSMGKHVNLTEKVTDMIKDRKENNSH